MEKKTTKQHKFILGTCPEIFKKWRIWRILMQKISTHPVYSRPPLYSGLESKQYVAFMRRAWKDNNITKMAEISIISCDGNYTFRFVSDFVIL